MPRSVFLSVIAFLLLQAPLAYAENFPKPVELEQDVHFWVRVYTEIDTRSGFIHDSRNLAVVYETVRVDGSRRANKRKIKKAKARYVGILKKLAAGKRKGLNADEQRVLAAWGENISNKRLHQAARDIRFQLGQSNRFREGLIRSGEWRPYINQTLKDLQMPPELAALPHVESSFNPEAYSRVGAAGIWQFIRSTGKRYMQIDYVVDERMDPFASTVAAAKLLRHNHSITNSWPLALTAYNHGVASMRRAINKLGTRDIATIVRKYKGRAFGFASRNFYVAFLAALEIDSNPEKYFDIYNKTKPYNYEIVELQEYLLAKSVAKTLKIDMDSLRLHNRSLLEPVWSGAKRIPKGYKLRIPKNVVDKPVRELLAAIPNDEKFAKQTPDAFHKVVRGDTISEIATRYGHSIKELKALNGLGNRNLIRVGQVLRLPVKGGVLVASNNITAKKKSAAPVTAKKISETPKPIVVAQAPKQQPRVKDVAKATEVLPEQKAEEVETKTVIEAVKTDAPIVLEKQIAVEADPASSPAAQVTEDIQIVEDTVPATENTQVIEGPAQANEDIPAIEDSIQVAQLEENENNGISLDAEAIVEIESVAEPELETAEHATLLTDPSDYTVADDQTIEVQASETLGHYAEWLDLRASQLRKINGMRFGKPVVIGRRIELDFSRVPRDQFEHRRITYQQNLQEEFFTHYRIDSTKTYVIKRGESLWVLALRKFKVPIWLIRQHNPDVDFDRIRPGTEIVVPELLEVQLVNGGAVAN